MDLVTMTVVRRRERHLRRYTLPPTSSEMAHLLHATIVRGRFTFGRRFYVHRDLIHEGILVEVELSLKPSPSHRDPSKEMSRGFDGI
ncbi:hypothetical protein AVEN_174750-1 [Araneus ventricosus]|uniref:Uncharacterized protein n=1 Tax=Araneus ventricosus TaxID=182803 RepID=A0A4Y2BJN7_ARAVE|nr:hypothetical protein AVEN_174750-1 [Araneus ventricosus]